MIRAIGVRRIIHRAGAPSSKRTAARVRLGLPCGPAGYHEIRRHFAGQMKTGREMLSACGAISAKSEAFNFSGAVSLMTLPSGGSILITRSLLERPLIFE